MKAPGFTLVEIMVAVVILGILAAIALPSYARYVEEGNVTNAKSALLQIQTIVKKQALVNPELNHKDPSQRRAGLVAEFSKALSAVDKSVTDRYEIRIPDGAEHISATPKINTGYKLAARIDRHGNALFCLNSAAATNVTIDNTKCAASLNEL